MCQIRDLETKTWKENVGNKPKLRLYEEFKRDKDREKCLEQKEEISFSKISLECIYEAYRDVKDVIDNAGASKVKCSQDIVVTCKPCWAGRTV